MRIVTIFTTFVTLLGCQTSEMGPGAARRKYCHWIINSLHVSPLRDEKEDAYFFFINFRHDDDDNQQQQQQHTLTFRQVLRPVLFFVISNLNINVLNAYLTQNVKTNLQN